jgi:hypothetical protein
MKKIIQHHELTSFFLLGYLLSWLSVPFMQGGQTTWGLAIAARVVIGATLGAQGVREYHKRLANWRAGWWYLVGPLMLFVYQGLALVISLALGARLMEMPHLSAGALAMLLLFGGQWEEFGWTAYALPRLRERFANHPNGSLIAVLVLGFFRMLWHLPLFLYGKLYWFDIVILSFAFQILLAWLYDRSNGSLPAVMLTHFTSNILGAMMSSVFAGSDRVMFYALFISLAALFSTSLLVFSQFNKKHERVIIA